MKSGCAHAPQIVQLSATYEPVLADLFARIVLDRSAGWFTPHPFDRATAASICRDTGQDLYFLLMVGERAGGYGMLRGWNQGFDVPSLGIYLTPQLRGTGAARSLLEHLHLAARLAGAQRVRLKVHPDNPAALQLYRKIGYVFDGRRADDGQWIGVFELTARIRRRRVQPEDRSTLQTQD